MKRLPVLSGVKMTMQLLMVYAHVRRFFIQWCQIQWYKFQVFEMIQFNVFLNSNTSSCILQLANFRLKYIYFIVINFCSFLQFQLFFVAVFSFSLLIKSHLLRKQVSHKTTHLHSTYLSFFLLPIFLYNVKPLYSMQHFTKMECTSRPATLLH